MGTKIILPRKVRMEVIDSDPEAILKLLADADIQLESITFPSNLAVHITAFYRDIDRISSIINRRSAKYKVLSRVGLFWNLLSFSYRPILLLGGIVFLILSILLPGRILRVDVVGNTQVPTRYILQCAETSGIKFGSTTKVVRSERIKNQILSAIPGLQWVGINTKGCVATIQVKERDTMPLIEKNKGVASIVAVRDGIISDLVVHSGTPLCAPGKSVCRGEVLISGYTDAGLKVTATVADGEVFAYTQRDLDAILPVVTTIQGEKTVEHTCYRLQIGKKVINFCNHSGIYSATCDKMYLEYYWALTGGFRLPISVTKVIYRDYALQTEQRSASIPSWLERNSEAYLFDQMVAGEILQEEITTETTDAYCRLQGVYFCHEMIGKVRYEEILEKHAENN